MTNVVLKLVTPSVPNFVKIEMPSTGKREDGFKESPMIAVSDLSDEQIESLVKDWRLALIANAKRQREVNKQP